MNFFLMKIFQQQQQRHHHHQTSLLLEWCQNVDEWWSIDSFSFGHIFDSYVACLKICRLTAKKKIDARVYLMASTKCVYVCLCQIEFISFVEFFDFFFRFEIEIHIKPIGIRFFLCYNTSHTYTQIHLYRLKLISKSKMEKK